MGNGNTNGSSTIRGDYIALLIFAVGAGALLWLGFNGLQHRVHFNATSEMTTGTVTNASGANVWWNSESCTAYMRVSEFGSRISRTWDMSKSSCDSLVGKPMTVSFDPDDHRDAIVGLKKSYSGWPIFSLTGGGILFVFVLFLWLDIGSDKYRIGEVIYLIAVVLFLLIISRVALQNWLSTRDFNSNSLEAPARVQVLDKYVTHDVYDHVDEIRCYKLVEVPSLGITTVKETGQISCKASDTEIAFDPDRPADLIVGRSKSLFSPALVLFITACSFLTVSGAAIYSTFVGRVFPKVDLDE